MNDSGETGLREKPPGSESPGSSQASIMRLLLNECMLIERQQALNAAPYQRSESRHGQAKGFKPKTVKTRVGPLQLAVPQVRGASFYPSVLERGSRSEKALLLALAEMYVPDMKELARHATVAMTMRYVHAGIDDQAKAIQAFPWQRSGSDSGVADRPAVSSEDPKAERKLAGTQNENPCGDRGFVVDEHPVSSDGTDDPDWRRRESNH